MRPPQKPNAHYHLSAEDVINQLKADILEAHLEEQRMVFAETAMLFLLAHPDIFHAYKTWAFKEEAWDHESATVESFRTLYNVTDEMLAEWYKEMHG